MQRISKKSKFDELLMYMCDISAVIAFNKVQGKKECKTESSV